LSGVQSCARPLFHLSDALALCRKLAEGLGGSIEAELADGRFVVSVALPDADAPTA
jgi:hypothetical protein